MHKLIETNREKILALGQKNGVVNIRVFGSMARDEVTDTSDVDFLVELAEGHSGLALGGFLMDMRDLLGRQVDVVTEKALYRRY